MYEGFSTCVARHTRTERALQFVGFLCGINRHEACFAVLSIGSADLPEPSLKPRKLIGAMSSSTL